MRVRPLKRPRTGRGGNIFQPKADQAELINRLCEIRENTIEDNFFLECHFVFKKGRFPGDIDNLLKAVLDALTHSQIIVDDRNCVGINSTINYGQENLVLIEIVRADKYGD